LHEGLNALTGVGAAGTLGQQALLEGKVLTQAALFPSFTKRLDGYKRIAGAIGQAVRQCERFGSKLRSWVQSIDSPLRQADLRIHWLTEHEPLFGPLPTDASGQEVGAANIRGQTNGRVTSTQLHVFRR